MANICNYCNKTFKKESTLFVHVCEQKRRALAKDEKHVRIAFEAFNRFYKKMQNNRTEKTYEEFCKSQYYTSFIKFGSFVSNVNPLYPNEFIDYVVCSGEKLDNWPNEDLYEKYIINLLNREPVEVALERSINTMTNWANDTNNEWDQYFNYVTIPRVTFDIKDGKISPWLLLNCKSGQHILSQIDDAEIQNISRVIDFQAWIKKFKNRKKDMEFVKLVVEKSNL